MPELWLVPDVRKGLDRRALYLSDVAARAALAVHLPDCGLLMPAVSKRQQEMMGADLARARAGKKTRTGMSIKQLKEFASTKRKGLPERAPKKRRGRFGKEV